MTETERPTPVPPAKPPSAAPVKKNGRDGFPIRLVLIGALAFYAVLLVLFNADEVDVSFVFFSAQVSLVVALVLALGIGFAAGYMLNTLRERRRGKPSGS